MNSMEPEFACSVRVVGAEDMDKNLVWCSKYGDGACAFEPDENIDVEWVQQAAGCVQVRQSALILIKQSM